MGKKKRIKALEAEVSTLRATNLKLLLECIKAARTINSLKTLPLTRSQLFTAACHVKLNGQGTPFEAVSLKICDSLKSICDSGPWEFLPESDEPEKEAD